MNPETWRRVEQICSAALDRAPGERKAFLDEACGGDDALRREVDRLIASDEKAGSFLSSPAWDVAATTSPDKPAESPIGRSIDHYEIRSSLGAGGMGEVYLARDTRLGRDVALKLLPARFTTDPGRVHRFEQEVRAVSALNHPNIVSVYDIGESESGRFIVMEMVAGRTLRALAREPIPHDSLIPVAEQAAKALAAAHAAGIVHRDVKPENVMLRDDGYVKVLDFGLARLMSVAPAGAEASFDTSPGTLIGTMSYMSPEQARCEAVTSATDIFSLGIIFYELATAQHPFAADSQIGVLHRILSDSPVPPAQLNPEIPIAFDALVLRMLEKDPNLRPTAAEVEAALASPAARARARGIARHRWVPGARKTRRAAAAGLVAAVTSIVVFGVVGRPRVAPNAGESLRIGSLAVLPLENLSNDPEQEYFSDGMTEALIAGLARVSGLRVISRTSVMAYKSARKPLPQIARELNVDAVLEGSVTRSGDRVRITAQLIDAKTDRHVWANSYERDLRDVLSLQNEVARAVAQEIRITVTPQEAARLAAARPVNAEAHSAYLRGRYFVSKGTMESFRKAIEEFSHAIGKDSSYAPPYAGLSDAYAAMRFWSYAPPHSVMPQARAAAAKAIELDPALAEGHLSMAMVLMSYDFDWPAAEAELKRAIDLSPNHADAHHYYALYLAGLARHDEAHIEIERARELDPLSLPILADAAWAYYLARRYDRAIEVSQKAIELEPNFWPAHVGLGIGYERIGRFADAVAELKKAKALDVNPTVLEMLAGAYAAWGKVDEAKAVLTELNDLTTRHYVCPYEVATVYACLGDEESTLRWLEKGYEERADCMAWAGSDPKLDGLRGDPRFENLLKRMGIPR